MTQTDQRVDEQLERATGGGALRLDALRHPDTESAVVQTQIEHALERRAERGDKQIAVSVHDGTLTLAGIVHSWAEKHAALGAARGHGVRTVVDHLRVEPLLAVRETDELCTRRCDSSPQTVTVRERSVTMAATDVSDKRALDHQFERISWALFLIMLGGLGLVPGGAG